MVRRLSVTERFARLTTKQSLTEQFDESIRRTTAAGRDGLTPRQFSRTLARDIRAINRRLRSGTYEFSPYRLMLKSKGPKKVPREIAIPIVRDRVVLRAMCALIQMVAPQTMSELPQPKIQRVITALESGRFTHFIRLDVMNFYPSVSNPWLESRLRTVLRRPELVKLYMNAIGTPTLPDGPVAVLQTQFTGIPQGLAVSNALAELSVLHVDNAIEALQTVCYVRYVDDILVLTTGRAYKRLVKRISEELQRAGLEVHPLGVPGSKSQVGKIADGFDYLGYEFCWPRITVRSSSIGKLEASLARSFTRYKYAASGPPKAAHWQERCLEKLLWHLDLIITGCVFENNRRGWLSYFSQIRHVQLLRHLDDLVDHLVTRFGLTGQVAPKRFLTAYRFAASRKRDTSGYVPDFDRLSIGEQRRILHRIFFVRTKILNLRSDLEIAEMFKARIKRVVNELDRDVGLTS